MASIINMPKLSPTMEEGVLAKWTKKEGDKIAPGDVIAEVETDKANMEFPLEDEGVLLKLLVKEGDTVKLGDPVAILGEAGEDPATAMNELTASSGGAAKADAAKADAAKNKEPAAPPVAATARAQNADRQEGETKAPDPARPAPPSAKPQTQAQRSQPAQQEAQEAQAANGHGRVLASPFARKLALEKGVDLRAISGSGPRGRIVQRDIEEAAAGPVAGAQLRSVPAGGAQNFEAQQFRSREDRLVAPSQMRKTIAKRLVEAKRESPHIYLTADATVDKLVALREDANAAGDVKISINDFVMKAMALALARVPEANVSWTAEGIVQHGGVHVGMAVSLPDGLITPVVRDADLKSLGALARETKSLAERARAKKLKPEEFSGGSATVSNLGMFGIRDFVAIINPPESVILAVGATEKRAVVVEKDGEDDEIKIARRMTLTLSCDHRVVDGVLGAKLLGELVKLLEKPMGMLL
jgi:pyruvate dehydrogenase E2 component (dihydrolipoamide acetyltransferase)